MPAPQIDALPPAPSVNDPATFPSRASNFVAAWAKFREQLNAVAAYIDNLAVSVGPGIFKGGSAGQPSITRENDLDTGIFFPSVNTIAFSTGGTEKFRVSPNGYLILQSGSTIAAPSSDNAGAPTYSWSGEQTTGIYRHASGIVGVTINGQTGATFEGPGTTLNSMHRVVTREKGDARYQMQSSSIRYKVDVGITAPADLSGLECKEWVWGGDLDAGDARVGTPGTGLIAEDLAEVAPGCVTHDAQGRIDGINALALLGHVIGHYNARIGALEARIATLEAQ